VLVNSVAANGFSFFCDSKKLVIPAYSLKVDTPKLSAFTIIEELNKIAIEKKIVLLM
jgi:hypothetical protein